MYVEFQLTTKDDNHNRTVRTELAHFLINRDLHAWSDRYGIPYKTKVHKLTKRIIFDDIKNYSFFALTFEPTSYTATRWSLVEPMSRPKSID
jgi:hypothetical protein